MLKLKVWGGSPVWSAYGQQRVIVAAASQKKAVAILNGLGCNVSLHHFSGYWSRTGNSVELSTADHAGVWMAVSRRTLKTATLKLHGRRATGIRKGDADEMAR